RSALRAKQAWIAATCLHARRGAATTVFWPMEAWENEGGRAPTADELSESLDWAAFSAGRFPDRRRHDLEALVAYARYRAEADARDPQSVAAEHDRGSAAT